MSNLGPQYTILKTLDVRNTTIALELFFSPSSTSKIILSATHNLVCSNQVYQGWFLLFQAHLAILTFCELNLSKVA